MFALFGGKNSKSSNGFVWKLLKSHKTCKIRNHPINFNDRYILYSTDFNVGEQGVVKYDIKEKKFEIIKYAPSDIKPKYHCYCKYRNYIYIFNPDGNVMVFNINNNTFKRVENIKNKQNIGEYSSCINIEGSDIIHILGGLQNQYHLVYSIENKQYIKKQYLGDKIENPSIIYLKHKHQLLMYSGYVSKSFFIGSIISDNDDEIKWEKSEQLTMPHRLADCGYILYEDNIIIFGGCVNDTEYSDNICVIKLQNNLYQSHAKIATAQNIHCPSKDTYHAVLINDEIHLFSLGNEENHHSLSIKAIDAILREDNDAILREDNDENDLHDAGDDYKHNHNDEQNDDHEDKDDIKDEEIAFDPFRIVSNPYIVIIGISEYETLDSLPAVKQDVANMKELWTNTYGYKYVKCLSDEVHSKYITKTELNDYITKRANELGYKSEEYNCDALIFIYSGHGANFDGYKDNLIITSDGQNISLSYIQPLFSKMCSSLHDKPKMFFMDCCRGTDQNIDIKEIAKGHSSTYISEENDIYTHFATSSNHQSYTKENKLDGSYLCAAIYKCYTETYGQHKNVSITLHDTSLIINSIINKESKGKQTSEIADRLTYDVYITTNNNHKKIKQPLTRTLLMDQLESLRKENSEIKTKMDQLQRELLKYQNNT